MRNLILPICVIGLSYWIQQGPSPVTEPVFYVGLLIILSYFGGKFLQVLGLPVEVGYVAAGVIARGSGVLPSHLLTVGDPLISIALGWVGLSVGFEIGRIRNHWRISHLPFACLCGLLPCLFAVLFLKVLFELPTATVMALGVAASLTAPMLNFASLKSFPETRLVIMLCGGISLLLYGLTTTYLGTGVAFISGIGFACVVAGFWFGTLTWVESALKGDTPLLVLLFGMVILLQWTSATLGHSLLLTALMIGFLVSLRANVQARLRRILDPTGKAMSVLLLSAFGMQIAVERIPDIPNEVWAIAAVYLCAMIGGKLIGGALIGGKAHPYGRLAGIAVLPQGLLLLEIHDQVRGRNDIFAGSADTIHAVLGIAALVGCLFLPFLDHFLKRSYEKVPES